MAVVRILGIDPGTSVVGFGCLELRETAAPIGRAPMALRAGNVVRAGPGDQTLLVLDAGVLRLGSHRPIAERLRRLAQDMAALLERLQPQELALEEAFYGKSVQSALRIGEARGVVLAESARRDVAVHQFAPARIKRCITGGGAASKEAVAAMVLRLLPAGPWRRSRLPGDATDALAVALTRAEMRRSPLTRLTATDRTRRPDDRSAGHPKGREDP